MAEINLRMTGYVADRLGLSWQQASDLRERYWQRYGATLLGLMRHHGVSAREFLHKTHPLDELPNFVQRISGERERLQQLRGEKWLFTNAPRAYAHRVLELIGLKNSFDRTITIEDMRFCGRCCPKPSPLVLQQALFRADRPAHRVILIDDHDENLRAAHALGMRTARIWVSKTACTKGRKIGRPPTARRPSYVQVQVNSLAELIKHQHQLTR